MEYLPHIIATLALLVALFFRSPKEANAELRADLVNLWTAHNLLAREFERADGKAVAQYNGHEKELGLLRAELHALSGEIRTLSNLIRDGESRDRLAGR